MEKNGKKSVLGAFANIFTEKDKHGGKEPIDTDEYLSELARSAEEYHSDSTDARGVAAKKGFARSGESDEDGYEVFRTREGVPKPPEGLIFLYRTDEEGEYMTPSSVKTAGSGAFTSEKSLHGKGRSPKPADI